MKRNLIAFIALLTVCLALFTACGDTADTNVTMVDNGVEIVSANSVDDALLDGKPEYTDEQLAASISGIAECTEEQAKGIIDSIRGEGISDSLIIVAYVNDVNANSFNIAGENGRKWIVETDKAFRVTEVKEDK